MNNTNKRGILILALGHPQYGRMAANLAASIRYNNAELPIHLVYSGKALDHLTAAHKALFTSMANCPAAYYTQHNKADYFKAKTYLYELSPFEETLYLDCDLLLYSKTNLANLLLNLSMAGDFDMQSRGYTAMDTLHTYGHYTHWCNPADVKKLYGISAGRFYQLSSELVFFKKTPTLKRFFESVQDLYAAPGVPTPAFAGSISDELAYNLAALQHHISPVEAGRVFIFWDLMDKTRGSRHSYYGYSAGGNNASEEVCACYNLMSKFYANALNLPMAYQLQPKKQWSPERRTF